MNKKIKNLLLIILSVALLTALSGCGTKNAPMTDKTPFNPPLQKGESRETASSTPVSENGQAATSTDEINMTDWKIYRNEKWYRDFIDQTVEINKFNTFDYDCTHELISSNCYSEKITEKDIADLMYLEDKNIVVALIKSSYGGDGFKLLKYDVNQKELKIADREDAQGGKNTSWYKEKNKSMGVAPEQKQDIYLWFAPPAKIISYNNERLDLSGKDGDAGCWQENNFMYDVAKNYIYIIKQCSGCEEEKEMTCVNF